MIMDREQAVSVLKQLFEQSDWIQRKSLKLMPPKANNALSNTFQIHIKTNGDDIVPRCIRTIASQNGLTVKQKDGFIIIYKPYPNLGES